MPVISRRPNAGQVGVIRMQPQPDRDARLRPNPRSRGNKPGVIFKRSDTPFSGEGTHVMLTREGGVTKRGFLDVPFRFQIPPLDSWTRSFTGRWSNFDVVGGAQGPRERTRFSGPGLRTVQFRTMFMDWHPSWGVWEPDVLEPILAVRELERLARRGIVFRLRVRNRDLYDQSDVYMLATILQGDVEEVSGEPDTRYVTLSFQEYDELEVDRRQRGDGPWSHTITAGDTLYALARRYYGNQTLWGVIAAANRGMLNWAPGRPLTEWRAIHNRKRIKVPEKPRKIATWEPDKTPRQRARLG